MGRANLRDAVGAGPWAWCALCCIALAASPICHPLVLEQRLLLVAWPASCAWQLRERRGRRERRELASKAQESLEWPAKLLRIMATLSVASLILKVWRKEVEATTATLPCASLLSLVQMTFPSLELPLGEFIPWWSLLVLALVATFGSTEMRADAGLILGRTDGGPLVWSAICVAISTLALVGWSKLWVRGNHGPIQDALAPLMSPASLLPLAVVNAFREPALLLFVLGFESEQTSARLEN